MSIRAAVISAGLSVSVVLAGQPSVEAASAVTAAQAAEARLTTAPAADLGVSAAELGRFADMAAAVQSAAVPEPPDEPSFVRVSQPADGSEPNGPSEGEVSAAGTEVFLTSSASNLVVGDTNGATDVFVKDIASGAVTRLSTTSTGSPADGGSTFLSASEDGSKVLFRSTATNLVSGDTNDLEDFFLLDRSTGGITRVNVSANGRQISKAGDNWSEVSLSPDGNQVAYHQQGRKAGYAYLKNLSTGSVAAVNNLPDGAVMSSSSPATTGGKAHLYGNNGPALFSRSAFSRDGRYLFFIGYIDSDPYAKVYRWNIATGTSELVSDMPDPDGRTTVAYDYKSSSADGRFVAIYCHFCEQAEGVLWDMCSSLPAACPAVIWVKDMVTGQSIKLPKEVLGPPEPRSPGLGNQIRDAQISPDGRLVLVVTKDFQSDSPDHTWAVYDMVSGASAVLFGPDPHVFGVRWAASGAGFSFVSAPGSLDTEDSKTASNVFYMGAMASPSSALGLDDYGGTVGNYTRTDTDASIASFGPELKVTRTYNSMDGRPPGAFGPGWSFNFAMRLDIDKTGDANVLYPDGRVERHRKVGSGFEAPTGYASKLVETAGGYQLTQRDDTVFTFGASGQLTAITNANGHQLTLTYSSGQLTKVTAAAGRYLAFTWTGDRITTISTNPVAGAALTWKYYYSSGRLTAVCDPRNNNQDGACQQYTYGGGFKGQLLTKTARPDGSTVESVSYQAGTERMASRSDGTGATWSYTYPDPRIAVETSPRGHQTRTNYDADYRAIKIADPNGFVTYGYDAKGFRDEVRDANGNVVTTTYNAKGDPTSTTDGEGNTAYSGYNAAGQLIEARSRRSSSATDNRYLTTYDYDANGNKTRETTPPTADQPNGTTRRWVYTTGQETAVDGGLMPAGLLKTEYDARDNTTSYEYDATGDLRVVVDRTGRRTEYAYDALGRKATATEFTNDYPGGLQTTFSYDPLGEVTETVSPAVTDRVTGERHQLRIAREFNGNHQLIRETRSDLVGGDPARVTEYGYDAAGRLDLVRDPLQGELTRVYDAAGNVRKVTDQAGQVFETRYDESNRPTSTVARNVTDPVTGQVSDITLEERAYDAGGRLTATLDPLGRTRTYAYDNADRLLTVTQVGYDDRDGSTRDLVLERYAYDKDGNVTASITGNAKRREERTWTEDSRLKTLTVAPATLNRQTTFTYDANGNVQTESLTADGRAEETRYVYDAADRVTRATVENDANDLTTAYAYDQRGNLAALTDPRGAPDAPAYTTNYEYDEAGNPVIERAAPTQVTTGGGTTLRPTTTYGYNTYGDATTVKTPTGAVTTTSYDKLSRPTTIRYPDYTRPDGVNQTAATESMAYSATGNLIQWTDRRGGVWDFTFDSLNRPVRTQEPAAGNLRPITTTSYDKASNPIEVVDAENAVRQATYDDLNRQRTATITVGSGEAARPLTMTYDYDDLGNRTYLADALGHVTRSTYNAESELTSSTDALDHTTTFGYDLRGRPTATTDPLGHATRDSYDLAGRREARQTLTPAGTVVATWSYGYDAASNLTTTTSPEGRTAAYTYDANNWLATAEQTPDAGTVTTTYGYNANGDLTSIRDGRGNTTAMSYNSWGLLESTVEPATAEHPALDDRTWTRSYDPAGSLAQNQQPGGSAASYTYDPLGRMTQQAGSGTLAAATRTFEYDLTGRTTSFSHPAGTQTLAYDQRNLLVSAAGPAGNATLTYDDAGRLITRADSNGSTTFTWNDAGYLANTKDPLTGLATTIAHDDAGKPLSEVARTGDGATVNTRAFGYDNRGRLTSDVLTSPSATLTSQTYGYDNDNLLTSATTQLPGNPAAGTHAYAYDGAGRLKQWTRSGGATVDYSYDNAGNLIGEGSKSYSYDERNRLIATPDGPRTYNARGDLESQTLPSGATRTSAFDSLGQLTSSGSTSYTYDALSRIATTGTTDFTYVGTASDPIGIGAESYTRTPGGHLLSATTGGNSYQAGSNRRGDLTHLVAADGSVAGTTTYTPLGAVDANTGTNTSLGWQSDYTDPGTGMVHMGVRWYDPQVGGFISRDTYNGTPSLPVSLNRYTYANGNPLEFIDPTGYCGWSLSGLGDCISSGVSSVASSVTSAASYAAKAVSSGVKYAADAISSAAQYVSNAASRAWNAGTEALKSVAATANRGVTLAASATFGGAKTAASVARKAGTYTAATLLNFGAAAVGKAKNCLTTSGTCRTVVTAVAVTAVAVACTACLVPMAIGAGVGGSIGAGHAAATCPPDQDRAICALKGGLNGALSGALAGAAGAGAASAIGRTALAGSRLAQYSAGGATAGLTDEATRQFMSGEANPSRLAAATLGGAGLGAATHGAMALGRLGRGVAAKATKARLGPGPSVTGTGRSDVVAATGRAAASGPVRVGDVGSYAGLQGRSVVGDGLDLHHMPQAAAGFTSRAEGASVALPRAEHVLTRTYGVRGAQALKADADLGFRDVLAKDLWDLRAIGGSAYNQSIRDVIGYYRTNFPELMAR